MSKFLSKLLSASKLSNPLVSEQPTEKPSKSTSFALRKGTLRKSWAAALLLLTGVCGTLVGVYRWQRHNYRRFQEVRPGVLYRMGIPSERGFRQIVDQYGIRTVICLLEVAEPRLKAGWFYDGGQPSGPPESRLAEKLGVRFLHWPLPNEGPWPWPKPEYLEEFFQVMDQPSNWPVLIHCWAGKHRTGTLVAIFRLEYESWPVEKVLEEMYAFDFKAPFPLHEHNLRTYVRRPRPNPQQWETLQQAFLEVLPSRPTSYEQFVGLLRGQMDKPAVAGRLEEYLRQAKPFGVCLADWLIEGPEAPWLPVALQQAENILFSSRPPSGSEEKPTAEELASAAGLLADYGSSGLRRRLSQSFWEERHRSEITPRYQAMVAGLTNRYRPTRLPYLKLLLEDRRPRPEPQAAGAFYADTAAARTAAIVQEDFLPRRGQASRQEWNQAIQRAQQWFADHPLAGTIPEIEPSFSP